MKRFLLRLTLCALIAPAARGGEWVETDDARALPPGQSTLGVGPLTAIHGAIDPGDTIDSADMYCIRITDVAAFSATTVAGASWDTQLWLFDHDGVGVAANDDSAAGLQSTLSGAFVPGPGPYLLAISGYDHDPINAIGLELWADSPYALERAPDGPGAPGPIAEWIGDGAGGPYSIFLTGATFCAIPEPATLVLLALGGLLARRRRA